MNVEQYINAFRLQHSEEIQPSGLRKVSDWLYSNTQAVKIAEASGVIFGTGSIALLPLTLPPLGAGAIALAAIGGTAAAASLLAHRAIDTLVSSHHEMSDHVFKPATYGVGKLYYQGDIPILELNSDDPHSAGVAHGYLMGPPLEVLLSRINLIKYLNHMPDADLIPETLDAIRGLLPIEYIQELEGIVQGFNQWSKETSWFQPRILTVNDLILFHLMPDSLHFSPGDLGTSKKDVRSPSKAKENNPLGCTVIIDKDSEKGFTFGRNMDWPSFGLFGTYSLVINRKHSGQKISTVELGFPGFVGTLTGMNSNGLSLAMNVCLGNTTSVQGIPAAFYNRMCLETCRNLRELEGFVDQRAPLGSYHLSAADSHSAKSFHFYQGGKGSLVTRRWNGKKPLITTNCRYSFAGVERDPIHCSAERKEIIQDLFNEAKNRFSKAKLIEASLSLPYVNNSITTQKVVMNPRSKKIQLAVDNAFAGQIDLHDLDTSLLF